MSLEGLPNELITQLFLALPTVSSVIAFASTSARFRHVYYGSQRLSILASAAGAEFGPIAEIVQLVTQNASQPAHVHRDVPMSAALLHQVIEAGRVAQRWEELYPFKKWKTNFAERRLLTDSERFTFRRALYRLWLYSSAYHTSSHGRTGRNIQLTTFTRAALLHNFTTAELAEMLDVHAVVRDVVANNICPSNGKVRNRFRKRHTESTLPSMMFNIHLNYPPPTPASFVSDFIPMSKYHATPYLEAGAEGWGDDISHYYVVEDMMKLDPEQLLYLRDHCTSKWQVEDYVRDLGEWFGNNGETFSETAAFVTKQRGVDMEIVKTAIDHEEMGVVSGDV